MFSRSPRNGRNHLAHGESHGTSNEENKSRNDPREGRHLISVEGDGTCRMPPLRG